LIDQRLLPPPRPPEKPPPEKPPEERPPEKPPDEWLPEKLLELPPPPPLNELPPWQFAQVEPLPLEGELNDLLGALENLPEPSEDLKLRLPAEGELEDLSLVTLEPLEDLPSPGEDTREFISFRPSKLFRCLTERSPPLSKDWLLLPFSVNLRCSDRPSIPCLRE
jgi:hypothetical protein